MSHYAQFDFCSAPWPSSSVALCLFLFHLLALQKNRLLFATVHLKSELLQVIPKMGLNLSFWCFGAGLHDDWQVDNTDVHNSQSLNGDVLLTFMRKASRTNHLGEESELQRVFIYWKLQYFRWNSSVTWSQHGFQLWCNHAASLHQNSTTGEKTP